MSVDGIGKPGAGPSVGSTDLDAATGAAEVDGSLAPDEAGSVEAAGGSEALGRLQSGEIGVDAYLEARVNEAVRHLEGKLPAAELDFVRETLREQLSSDPVLVELSRRTTGSVPPDLGSR